MPIPRTYTVEVGERLTLSGSPAAAQLNTVRRGVQQITDFTGVWSTTIDGVATVVVTTASGEVLGSIEPIPETPAEAPRGQGSQRAIASGTQAQGQPSLGYMTGFTRYESRTRLANTNNPIVRPRLVYAAWYLLSGLVFVPQGYTLAAGIEYNSVFYPATFGGAATFPVLQNNGLIVSDPINCFIPAGALPVYAQTGVVTALTADRVPGGRATITANGENAVYNTSGDATQIGNIGAFTGTNIGKGYGPLMLIGETRKLSFILAGDSIFNEQDLDTAPDTFTNVGFAAKGGYLAGVPFINMSRTALRLSQVLPASAPAFWEAAAYCTDFICNFGTNDINNGRTLAQMQSDYALGWARARAMGAQRVHQMLIIPSTNAGNTVPLSANYAAGGLRDQVNAWIRSQVGITIDSVIDLNPVYESPTTPGLWASSTYTTDGIHPNNAGAEAGKNAFRDAVLAIVAEYE